MGRKHAWSRQHLYIYVTSLILLLLTGCALLEERQLRRTADEYLMQSRRLFHEGDFEGALLENRKVLSLFVKGPPGDEALFNIGLIYAHYNNPEKNYMESIGYFNTVINEYPQSSLVEQARMWSRILGKVIESRTRDVEVIKPEIKEKRLSDTEESLIEGWTLLKKGDYKGALKENMKVVSSPAEEAPVDEALFNIGLIYAHYDNPDKDYKQSIDYFKRLIEKYPASPFMEQAKMWVSVLDVIEKAKQVDIEIEEKKKELTR